jgi:hypothetical protein
VVANYRHPRAEAQSRLAGDLVARVLEPSPPAVHSGEYADDPVARGDATLPVVSPVSSGDIWWSEVTASDPDLAAWATDRWLGPWRRLQELPAGFEATRDSIHQMAYFVLAPARHRANTKIGLRYTAHGLGTPFFGDDVQIRVEGTELVLQRGREVTSARVTNLAEAAELTGIPYRERWFPRFTDPLPPVGPEAPLEVEERPMTALADWFGFGTLVLEELRAQAAPGDDPSLVQLWPEHLDPSLVIGNPERGRRATLGASPGDGGHPEPYLYVSPWGEVDGEDPVWNDHHFNGASLSYQELLAADDQRMAAVRFFRETMERLGEA